MVNPVWRENLPQVKRIHLLVKGLARAQDRALPGLENKLLLNRGGQSCTIAGLLTRDVKMKALLCSGLMATVLLGCGGSGGSGQDCSASVNACNAPPVADAGVQQNVLVGTNVVLDGGKSSDPDGNPLTYSWSVVSAPPGAKAILSTATSKTASFVADAAGIYLVGLTVNDGKVSSPVATATIKASDTNLSIAQTSYANGGSIPLRQAATGVGGSNLSTPLSIGDIPTATKRFAIVMDDETGSCQTGLGACRHWGVFNLPVAKILITEGENLLLQQGAIYGSNYTGSVGYLGPNSASGHTYKLTVYALSAEMPFLTGVPEYNRAKFEVDFKPYILGKATLTGVYP